MVNVSKTFLPPIEDFISHVQRAYSNGWLTNRGELIQELEIKISDFLELQNSKVLCLNNGTIPLQIALKLLGNGGEIITTPFSYVATTASIVWEGCTPIFVDIDPFYLTIDEKKIEHSITEKTTCILATHVFGNPCNIEEIEKIAEKHNLKVIYDGAHCFGVKYKGKSIFEYGDITTCSFHATKVFHTGEGGAIFCKDEDLFNKIFFSHNFGHNGPNDFFGLGINGKISELNAAMGLAVLPYIGKIFHEREKVVDYYLNNIDFKNCKFLKIRDFVNWNYSYFPVVFKDESTLLMILNRLKELSIFPRRYFYPSLNTLKYVNKIKMKKSENISSRILCLPLYDQIDETELRKLVNVINLFTI